MTLSQWIKVFTEGAGAQRKWGLRGAGRLRCDWGLDDRGRLRCDDALYGVSCPLKAQWNFEHHDTPVYSMDMETMRSSWHGVLTPITIEYIMDAADDCLLATQKSSRRKQIRAQLLAACGVREAQDSA